jgi:WD40 repeat protein
MQQPTPESNRPIPNYKFEGHEDHIWSIVFLHHNVHIVSSSYDGTMRKWRCNTGCPVGEPWQGDSGSINALALSPDAMTITCGNDHGSVQQWDTNGEMIKGVWATVEGAVALISWFPVEAILPAGLSMDNSHSTIR